MILAEPSGRACPKMSEAKDGRSQAHMDVLVAVFGHALPDGAPPKQAAHEAGLTKARSKAGHAKRVRP